MQGSSDVSGITTADRKITLSSCLELELSLSSKFLDNLPAKRPSLASNKYIYQKLLNSSRLPPSARPVADSSLEMAPSLPQFSAARMRSYVFRLPLFTRAMIFVIIAFWVVSMQSVWDVQQWGALIPKEIGLSTSQLLPNIGYFLCCIEVTN